MITISASVGLAGVNVATDARTVQSLLNQNRSRVAGAREIAVDGIVGPKTIGAINAFQVEVLHWREPDSLVAPNGKTLKALDGGTQPAVPAAHADPVPPPMEASVIEKPICFPLRSRPEADYHYPKTRREWHHRYFGAGRKDTKGNFRAHAGVDLIVPPETPVFAVDDGVVVNYSDGFFENTGALTVRHANGLTVRYGETSRPAPGLGHGTPPVKRGQLVAFVGKNLRGTSMLHIEFYAGILKSSLSTPGNLFHRRGDLVNPTGYLDSAIVEPWHG
jgi:murein DD-endopeptidase MepM/ murein hydrolase activator NlpD